VCKKFVSKLWNDGGLFWVSNANTIDGHDLTEILLEIAYNTQVMYFLKYIESTFVLTADGHCFTYFLYH
jgi:hypothetical protein